MNESRNEYDEYRVIMNAVIMKPVSFEFIVDMKRKTEGDMNDNETYEIMIELFWMMLFVGLFHFEET